MKILSNKYNHEALKLYISGSLACVDVELEFTDINDSRLKLPHHLPVLEVNSECQLFSPNCAARYLLPPTSEEEDAVDEWLEFEAVHLKPLISNWCSLSNKSDKNLDELVKLRLADIDNNLKGSKFLAKTVLVSVADVVLWSCLYPAFFVENLKGELIKHTFLYQWFKKLHVEESFKKAEEKLFSEGGHLCLQGLSSIPILRPSHGVVKSNKRKDEPPVPIVEEADVSDVTNDELKSASEAWKNGAALHQKLKPRVNPVLPIEGEKNILISSALPYVNNVPHLGNIIGCVLSADVFARFCRLRNWNTLFICGTDEYGTATETKAIEEGLTPKEICDKYFLVHDAVYKWFNIQFDHFGRTTTPEQTKICQEMFLKLKQNGFISSEFMEQLLCENCNRYLADRFVEGICPRCNYEDARGDQCDGCGHLINAIELKSPRCKVCKNAPVVRKSEQFFIDLPKVEPKLEKWLSGVVDGWSHNAQVITKSWLRDGLKPRCITRDLKWGIPVPLQGYEDKVFYVWFDAPIGYISITMTYTSQWKKWWQPKDSNSVMYYNFIGKDNVPFHSVMFPSTLLGVDDGFIVVKNIMATEYLNYEDGKFSKSRGVGVFGTDAQDTGIPADVWRFYLLYVRPESQDSSFSWADLAQKNNSELLNNLGNFVNRALAFANKFFEGKIPEMNLVELDYQLLAQVTREVKGYISSLEKAKLRDGIKHLLSISRLGNQYMQSQQPWVLVKGSESDKNRSGTVIGLSCNLACLLCILLHPYMPETSDILKKQLQAPDDIFVITEEVTTLLPAGHKLEQAFPMFSKIEQTQIDELKIKYSGQQKNNSPEKGKPDNNIKHVPAGEDGIAYLIEAVEKQGNIVREIKSRGDSKDVWQPHVDTLLELKRQLALAQGIDNVKAPKAKGKSKK